MLVLLGSRNALTPNFRRIIVWSAGSAVFWIVGAVAGGDAQLVVWTLAVMVDIAAPVSGFAVPRLGRSTTSDWTVEGGHLAERCQLFLILALGESIILTGATFSDLDIGFTTAVAFTVAFVGSVLVWWIYFDRSGEEAAHAIAESNDPGRLARSAYTYMHLPMVAGIIAIAVSDELVIAHPTETASWNEALVILGGTALFLLGHGLFLGLVFRQVPVPHILAIAVLAILLPFSMSMSMLSVATVAAATLLGVVIWKAYASRFRGRVSQPAG